MYEKRVIGLWLKTRPAIRWLGAGEAAFAFPCHSLPVLFERRYRPARCRSRRLPRDRHDYVEGRDCSRHAIPERRPARLHNASHLAWWPGPLASLGDALAAFAPQDDEVLLQPPITRQTSLRTIKAVLNFPEFKSNEREKLFGQLKIYAIHNEADYTAAKHCLAEAIYFESRDEPERGQRAVAQVVLNRAKSGYYPSTICGVIYQNANRRNACQFSYACDGKPERITELSSWRRAQRLAEDAITAHVYLKDIGNATHYHANYVWPDWRNELKRVKQIGAHIFYAMRT